MNWDCLELRFMTVGEGLLFSAEYGGEPVLTGTFRDGLVEVAIRYAFGDRPPLRLTGKAEPGTRIRVRLLPHRIELYGNGALLDEEWPCGRHFLHDAALRDYGCGLTMEECRETAATEPAVLGEFRNAEGWQPEEAVFVGDCMPYSHEGTYHVLYLKDRRHHGSKWGLGAHQWSHISTEDFVVWKRHPMAVEIDDPSEGSVCTGSWILHQNRHYLFYTIRSCDGGSAKICRSISDDGYHYQKDRAFAFTLSADYDGSAARDPKVIRDRDGLFHMLLTTGLRENGLGCLAHLTSRDLNLWTETEQPIYVAPEGMGQPECPDYFALNGFYYLVFSLRGTGHYRFSREPFSGWQEPRDPVIPCSSVPKAAVWQGRLIFTGFRGDGQYAGRMTFLEAGAEADGNLYFQPL